MKHLAIAVLSLCLIQNALAATDSVSSMSLSQAQSQARGDLAAGSREAALATESVFYSLPKNDMSYFEIGGYNQRQTFRAEETEDSRFNNQGFYFRHSRGVMPRLALDFNLNYSLPDEDARDRNAGINQVQLGARSTFNAMEMMWIYGGDLAYLSEGEIRNSDSRLAAEARIGFEEKVDIARWGLQLEGSTQNTQFEDDQINLLGFYEIPFVQRLVTGVSAGTDIRRLDSQTQYNFARLYGRYHLDSVSDAQLSLRQNYERGNGQSLTENELSLALTRVF